MKVVYNKINGLEAHAFEDPREPGRYVMPAGSTEIKPPNFDPSTQKCYYNESEWIVEDIVLDENLPWEPEDIFTHVRSIRNQLLKDTDWRVLPDYQGTDQELWLVYRQELRDILETYPSPTWNSETQQIENLVWPETPLEKE